jgi:5-oxopent-3-ene-1,2,5-tricarboxylate decarboxylase/2-hydroxyhepta-2,4-diene-1,7-dioate isomerase
MMTLLPGDLILSGTPANSRPVNPGDAVAVEVEGLGRLENTIAEGATAIREDAGWPPSASEKVTGVALGEQLRE